MTAGEFVAFRAEMIREYASEQVRAGSWGEEAEELAAKQTDDLLPDGAETPGMLVLAAENAAGAVVGRVWVALRWPGKIGAWICQIEVVAEQRGKGYGRALLRAAEEATAAEGVEAIGLNVFGENTVARSLYASSGYEITSLQMRKQLRAGHTVSPPEP
jgi:ribosomal protein S18 acetylase RimI-like enzyme